jgi:glyoxylase-like metal-dependent hydrolase (beta-lactamase superfamily II)
MNKPVVIGLAGLVLALAVSTPASAQFGSEPAKLDLIKLQDNVYAIHNDLVPGNITVVVTNDGVLLVDDKYEIDHDNVMKLLRAVTDKPVKYVINTHHHPDHSGGNAKLQADHTIAVASEAARKRMVEGKQSGLVDFAVQQHATLYLGDESAEIYWFGRGHTDGDVVVLFPKHRLLASGDLFTVGPGVPELIDYAGGGSAKEWPDTIGRVLKLDFDTVVPGHGPMSNKAAMQKYQTTARELVQTVSQLVKQGKPRADVEKVMRSQFGWEDFHVNMALDGLIKELR